MPRVKICGITNIEDAQKAIEFGADALGFVFYEKSPRYIEPSVAKEIVKKLPPFIEKVGLFVNTTASKINSACKESKMTLAQIHFDAKESLYRELELPHIKVIRATCKEDLSRYDKEYRIVDAFVKSFGGEGKRVELSWFNGVDCSRIILAGGLDARNFKEVKDYGFFGFDVSSGVEKSKGKKDMQKLKAFLKEAKN
ncbi:MAG: phosphoribosylanthranilate isomerase [Sulfurospirillum sp.]